MGRGILKSSFLFFLLTSFLASGFSFAETAEDSGISQTSLKKIFVDFKKLRDDHPKISKLIKYGESVKDRPLFGILFQKEEHPKSLVLVTGAIHGNEYLNLVDRLPQKLVEHPSQELLQYLDRGGAVFFIPVMNPDGYLADQRFNANYRDLNRDFSNPKGNLSFYEPESRGLRDWVRKFLKENSSHLKITVDYHCCHQGALLTPPEKDKRHDLVYSYLTQAFKDSRIPYGTSKQILGDTPIGTSKDYWHYYYGATAFTYEGRYQEEQEFLPEHVQWWNLIFSNL